MLPMRIQESFRRRQPFGGAVMATDAQPTASQDDSARPAPIDRRVTITLTPREAHAFILKLATDDAFRARLAANAGDVLAESGIYLPLDQIPVETLVPPKEALQRALQNFTTRGEIDVTGLLSPSGWPLMVFWWLYMTPAKPSRRRQGGGGDVPTA